MRLLRFSLFFFFFQGEGGVSPRGETQLKRMYSRHCMEEHGYPGTHTQTHTQ
jgi:hypothetical protein